MNRFLSFKSVMSATAICMLSMTSYSEEIEHVFIEGGIGWAEHDVSADGFGKIIDDGDTSFNFRVGAKFSPFIGVEMGYSDFGKSQSFFEGQNLSADLYALNLGAIIFIPMSSQFNLITRAGVSLWNGEFIRDGLVFEDDGSDAYIGAGVQLKLHDSLYIGGEYTHYDLDPSPNLDQKVDQMAVSLGVNF